MKTFQDFENLRNKKCAPFGNIRNYVIEWMADAYVAKLDGVQRIKSNIGHYDHDAKVKILRMVEQRVEDIGAEFDWADFID